MQVVLLEIINRKNITGVNRYVDSLLMGFREISQITFLHICLIQNENVEFTSLEESDNFLRINIPLPVNMDKSIHEKYWNHEYNRCIYDIIKPHLEKKAILHIHTINLIYLAQYIKTFIHCKIITHLHCIPWKSLLDVDLGKYNWIQFNINHKKYEKDSSVLLAMDCEQEAIKSSDVIICVTKCAIEYLLEFTSITPDKLIYIPNGLADVNGEEIKRAYNNADHFRLLFVGGHSHAKGFDAIIEALHDVSTRVENFTLVTAGRCKPQVKQNIVSNGRIKFVPKGIIPYEELMKLYQECDIGLIASLTEQCSYAAIEMMMFGIPIITTASDGLAEMFKDGYSALFVPTSFSLTQGLCVNREIMAKQIIRLMTEKKLREKIGSNARMTYLRYFQIDTMIQRTNKVYENLYKSL